MSDIGSVRMAKLVSELRPRIDSIFPQEKYSTALTGNSLIFLKGNDYLFKNLMESMLLAIVLISIIMVTTLYVGSYDSDFNFAKYHSVDLYYPD